MKIAVVTDYFPTSAQQWAGQSAYQTLRVLAQRHEVHVFYPEVRYPRWLEPASKGAELDLSWSPPDVKATYVRYWGLPVVSRVMNGYSVERRLYGPVKAFAPDVVLNYMLYPGGFAAARMARRLGVPSVLMSIGSDLNRLGDAVVARLKKQTLRRADRILTVSHDLAKTAVRLGADPAKTVAILNGCDTAVFHPRDKAAERSALGLGLDEEVVLYLGRLDVRKGLVELVEAAAALKAKRPKMRTYLVGSGSDEGLLRQAMAKHGVEQEVVLAGACPGSQVGVWMGAADVVTLPSYNEGCPNVVVEAVNAGRPVVATRVGGIPELMDESSGRLIPVKDVAALTAALDEVLSVAWDAEAISRKASRSWTDVADDTEAVLRDVVRRR